MRRNGHKNGATQQEQSSAIPSVSDRLGQADLDQQLLRILMDTIPDTIYFKDCAGRFVLINRAEAAHLGLNDPADAIGRTDFDFYPHSVAARYAVDERAVIETGQPMLNKLEECHVVGRPTRCYSTTKVPWRDADGTIVGTFGLSRDVTGRRQAEGETQRLHEELARVNRIGTMGQMAAALAHELNQPLAAIANYANGCVRRVRATSITADELVDVAERIARQAEQAGAVLRRMSGFLRKNEACREPNDINEIIRSVVELAEWQMRREHVAVQLELGPEGTLVVADTVQIQQVVLNLVQNACDAMRGCAHRPLVIRTEVDDEQVIVSVTDAGAGIADDVAARLFEPFFTTRPGGMGLGLAICQSIVQVHGGTLCFHDADGGGTSFSFTLPRAWEDSA